MYFNTPFFILHLPHPPFRFFSAGYGVPASEKPSLRVPSKVKEVLSAHLDSAEQRLLSEQKKVAQYQRFSKVQENLMSEEEKKKRRKLRKVKWRDILTEMYNVML